MFQNLILFAQTDQSEPGEVAKDAADATKDVAEQGSEMVDMVVAFVTTHGVQFAINLIAAIVVLAIPVLLFPVMPERTAAGWAALGLGDGLESTKLADLGPFGAFPESVTVVKGDPLFPRRDRD